MRWTPDQVLGLAPDPKSAQAGRAQSAPSRWSELGSTERALWGLCQGSGAKPYQTAVDLAEPAFSCSCPSRKFPCKHSLGLMLLWAEAPAMLPTSPGAPPWVAQWLAGREQRAARSQRRELSTAADPERAADDLAQAAAASAKRAREREARISQGLDELDLWLGDLIRHGLAAAQQRPRREWLQAAARLVDAQAPGLARRVRQLAETVNSGPGWPGRLLRQAGVLALLTDAYRRQEELGPGIRAEVRAQVGWNVGREEVLAGERVTGRWLVLGHVLYEDERLRARRVWLRDHVTGRFAMLLDFAAGSQPLAPAPAAGQTLDAELAFYPAAAPVRALIAGDPRPASGSPPPGYTVAETYHARSRRLAANPWSEREPVLLAGVPVRDGDGWWLADEHRDGLPLSPAAAEKAYGLLAVSAGRPVPIFGEWDERGVTPLSAWADGELWSL